MPDAPVPYQVGEALPVRLNVADMCRIFRIGRSGFHRLERQGKFRRFELQPKIGCKAWSGLRVARHLTNESFAIEIKRSA